MRTDDDTHAKPRVFCRGLGCAGMVLLLITLITGAVTGAAEDNALARFDQRVTQWLIGRDEVPLQQAVKPAERMEETGAWPDINYNDSSRTMWDPMAHVSRLETMARAVAQAEPDDKQAKLVLEHIEAGLTYWLQEKPEAENWWHRDIGVPKNIGPLLVMIGDHLPNELVQQALTLVPNELRHQQEGMDMDEILNDSFIIYHGLVRNDRQLVEMALDNMQSELVITTQAGVQPEYSFHNHGPQLYNGGYGVGSLRDFADWAYLTRNTPFAFADDKINLLVDWILKGDRWLTRHGFFDYSAVGRGIARGDQYDKARGWISICRRMQKASPKHAGELEAFIDHIRGRKPSITGNKSFWRSDFMSHKRQDYYASVALSSTDVIGTEIGNGENLKGFYTPFGGQFFIREGNEYGNIFPVWDWTRVPGVTAPQTKHPPMPAKTQYDWTHVQGETDFVGGASNGQLGLMAFDYAIDRGEINASGRKSWFFFDQTLVCLGAGLTSTTSAPLVTSVNQCLLDGQVTLHRPDRKASPLERNKRSFKGPVRIDHDGFAYIFPSQSGSVTVQATSQAGRWRDIHLAKSNNRIKKEVFSLWLEHGQAPRNGSYHYRVVPLGTPRSANISPESESSIELLANRPSLQAVARRDGNLGMAAFYEPGKITIGARQLTVSKPCTLILDDATPRPRLTLANPKGEALHVTVTIKSKDAETDRAQGRALDFRLPGGADGGKSVTKPIR